MEFKKLYNINVEIIDGDRGKNYPNGNDFKKEKYCLFLNAKNVTENGFNFSDVTFINKEKDNILRKGKLERKDIVLTTRGTVGNVAYYSDNVPYKNIRINSGMVIIRCMENIIPKYLYYALKSKYVQEQINRVRTGSAQPQLPISILKNIKVNISNVDIQKKIVKILEAIDNKIELNNQINDNLLKLNNELYGKYFIDNVEENTETIELEKLITVVNGYSYKGNELVEKSNIGMATIKNFERKGGFKEEGFKALNPSKLKLEQIVEINDIVVACTDLTQQADIIGNAILLLGKAEFEKIVISMDLVKIVPKEGINKFIVYSILNSKEFKNFALGYKSGTTVLHLNKKCFNDFKIKLPNEDILKKFSIILENNYKKISNIIEENRRLEKLRDTLLPKLMNGEIDLENIEL